MVVVELLMNSIYRANMTMSRYLRCLNDAKYLDSEIEMVLASSLVIGWINV